MAEEKAVPARSPGTTDIVPGAASINDRTTVADRGKMHGPTVVPLTSASVVSRRSMPPRSRSTNANHGMRIVPKSPPLSDLERELVGQAYQKSDGSWTVEVNDENVEGVPNLDAAKRLFVERYDRSRVQLSPLSLGDYELPHGFTIIDLTPLQKSVGRAPANESAKHRG